MRTTVYINVHQVGWHRKKEVSTPSPSRVAFPPPESTRTIGNWRSRAHKLCGRRRVLIIDAVRFGNVAGGCGGRRLYTLRTVSCVRCIFFSFLNAWILHIYRFDSYIYNRISRGTHSQIYTCITLIQHAIVSFHSRAKRLKRTRSNRTVLEFSIRFVCLCGKLEVEGGGREEHPHIHR